jgi:FemAB-related protein (PEP-CTERM system-associated)
MITIDIASDADQSSWNSFVGQQNISQHWFRWEWRQILSSIFGHQPYYLIARQSTTGSEEQSVVGIFPLFHVRSFLFGNALISVPYLNGGGIIAANKEVEEALLNKASVLAEDIEADYVEMRLREHYSIGDIDLRVRSHKVAMELRLQNDAEAQFMSFPAKLRSQIRRPTKSGVFAEVAAHDDRDALNDFYQVFAENMRDLGTPVYPRQLFVEATKQFGKESRIIVARLNRTPVAAGIIIGSGSKIEIPWASSLRAHNKLSPNMLLYWEAIKASCESGYELFDFGRSSPDSGTFRFKKQWGAKPRQLHWYYLLRRGEVPDVNPNSKKFALLVQIWRRMPIAATKVVGPLVTRALP